MKWNDSFNRVSCRILHNPMKQSNIPYFNEGNQMTNLKESNDLLYLRQNQIMPLRESIDTLWWLNKAFKGVNLRPIYSWNKENSIEGIQWFLFIKRGNQLIPLTESVDTLYIHKSQMTPLKEFNDSLFQRGSQMMPWR